MNPAESLALGAFDFELSRKSPADGPRGERGEARLLVLERRTGRLAHRSFGDLIEILEGETVYVNNSKLRRNWILLEKVLGHRHWAYLLERLESPVRWLAYFSIPPQYGGDEFRMRDGVRAWPAKRVSENRWELNFEKEPDLERLGEYAFTGIRPPRDEEDRRRYEPLYAKVEGSFMSPSAGVNLTQEMLDRLRIRELTLHIATNTHYGVREGEEPILESEYYEIPDPPSGPVVAVGTTVVKALETYARTGEARGWSDLMITPPFDFRAVKAVLTNFHRPRETLLMLACAFGGTQAVMEAYRAATQEGYRWSDYGDSMLIA
jgi:S-adenosylmethionine:tRNA ribosyltransferase-isomerase